MAYTNFCARSGGSNLNAGTRTGSTTEPGTSADLTYASGSWVASTGVFTVASGNPTSDGVAVGDFASVYDQSNSLYSISDAATTPDSASLSITGDIDIRVKLRLDDWTPGVNATIARKGIGGGNRAWEFGINTGGQLSFFSSANGTAYLTGVNSTAATGLSDGQTKWIRVTLDVDNGASGRDVKFYLSDDGASWTQLGTTVTTAGTTSIFDDATAMSVGAGGANYVGNLNGYIYYMEVLNGIGGTAVASPDFSTQSVGATSFNDTQGNTWTVGSGAVAIVAPSVTNFVGRVTARDATTITVSLTAKSGTAPVDGTSNRTLKIGGAWAGPSGAVGFPFGFVAAAMTNSAGDGYRVNYKNSATYSITAAITHALAGPGTHQGYTTAFGDGGKATFDGGTSGASYVLLSVTQIGLTLTDLIFQNNGATGSAAGLSCSNNRTTVTRVVVHDVRGWGHDGAATRIECEAYACNQSNTASTGGMRVFIAKRCISHDNTGSNSIGIAGNGTPGATIIDCVADSNGGIGFTTVSASQETNYCGCDAYNNGSHGFAMNQVGYMENCNAVKNGGYGVSIPTTSILTAVNCGFGSGTQANTSGQFSGTQNLIASGTVTYAADVTPWVDPANGDFRINLATAKGTGRGTFTQTASSYAGTVGHPDIGAAQHLESASGGGAPVIGNNGTVIRGVAV